MQSLWKRKKELRNNPELSHVRIVEHKTSDEMKFERELRDEIQAMYAAKTEDTTENK